jgi:hypothetical protein
MVCFICPAFFNFTGVTDLGFLKIQVKTHSQEIHVFAALFSNWCNSKATKIDSNATVKITKQ